MGRKRKADKPLNAMIPGIRATDEELQGLKDEAAEQGMSLTSYLRILIFRDAPRRKLKKLQLVDTQVLADLAKQGGNIRDLCNTYDRVKGFPREATEDVLRAMGDAARSITATYDAYLRKELA